MINRTERLQYADRAVEFQNGSEPEWKILNRLSEKFGAKVVSASTDRELTLSLLSSEPRLAGLKISTIKQGGVCLKTYKPVSQESSSAAHVGAM